MASTVTGELELRVGDPLPPRRWKDWTGAGSSLPGGLDEERSASTRRTLISFAVWVLIPTLIAAIYLFAIASDQYEARSQFVVRGNTNKVMGEAGGRLAAIIAINTNQDTYISANYIASGAVLAELQAEFDLKAIYGRPTLDVFHRLPSDATKEEIDDYWLGVGSAMVDPVSGVVSVGVRAFTPEEATALLTRTIELTEAKLNALHRLYLQSDADMAAARAEQAAERLAGAREDIKAFREEHRMLDTALGARSTFQVLSDLREQRIQTRAQLAVKRAQSSADAPAAKVLERRLAALDKQIADLEAELTGSAGGDMAALSAALEAYDALRLQEEVAAQFLTRALAAQNEAAQKLDTREVYLDAFVPPAVPEESRFPKRWSSLFATFAALLAVWAILGLILAGAREHQT